MEHSYNIGEQVEWQVRCELETILRTMYVNAEKPIMPKVKCEMNITVENAKPFSCSSRRLSYEREKLQVMLDEYIRDGIIRESSSEYASPIVLVKKKSGELRMCIDFRRLNKVVIKDNYPLPLIDDLLDRLVNKTVFTKLDLKNSYYHLFMDKESIKYTSFVTPLGQYEFLRMPMGLKTAPQVFQRFVNNIFMDLIKENKVIIYMDDIMIASVGMKEDLLILKEVLKRLVKNQLELRLTSVNFYRIRLTTWDLR